MFGIVGVLRTSIFINPYVFNRLSSFRLNIDVRNIPASPCLRVPVSPSPHLPGLPGLPVPASPVPVSPSPASPRLLLVPKLPRLNRVERMNQHDQLKYQTIANPEQENHLRRDENGQRAQPSKFARD